MELKKINEKIHLEKSLEWVVAVNELIDKSVPMDGNPYEMDRNKNLCPRCSVGLIGEGESYCALCGQKVRFFNSDILPL